jgi:hypothetical protein
MPLLVVESMYSAIREDWRVAVNEGTEMEKPWLIQGRARKRENTCRRLIIGKYDKLYTEV